tara:strand:- start:4510 stop:5643 length:1134 start_codon:yes stop_codon:yes gene_type:complete
MIKIGIINKGPILNWGKNFGYWFILKYFQDELKEAGYEITFYDGINKKFYNSDFIIIDSRLITDTYINKIRKKFSFNLNYDYLENIFKISKKNPNIIWLDLTDSSGTTSFEVLPYVKKYVKKQFYKDKDFYRKSFFRNRYYSDFYQKKFSLEQDYKFKVHKLLEEYDNKLVLGWNIGVGNFFDIVNSNYINKYKTIFQSLTSNNFKELYKNCLGFHNKKRKIRDVFCSFNLRKNSMKKSIHFQREKVYSILKDHYKIRNDRLNHKQYLTRLRESKVSVGAFGWGEICYREFEAIKMGAAVVFPKVDYLETWPNVYQDNFSYLSYELDFSNLIERIDSILNDQDLQESLIVNSQRIYRSVYSDLGLNYVLNFFKKITS